MPKKSINSTLDIDELIKNIFHIIISSQLILGTLMILDYIAPKFYPFYEGISYEAVFKTGIDYTIYIIILQGLWTLIILYKHDYRKLAVTILASIIILNKPIGLILLTLASAAYGIISQEKHGFLRSFFWLLTIINTLSILHYLIDPLIGDTIISSLSLTSYKIHYLSAYLSPILVLLVLFNWALKPLITDIFNLPSIQITEKNIEWNDFWLLSLSIILSLFAVLYPYSLTVNPSVIDFGKDFTEYKVSLDLINTGEGNFFTVKEGARPFLFMCLYGFQKLTGLQSTEAVRYFPIILNPLLVSAVAYYTWETFRNSKLSSWAGFFTATGFQITVGMYSYFLSNNLGLVLVFLSLGFLARYLRTHERQFQIISYISGGLLVFTHPWTMDHYILTIVPLGIYLVMKNRETIRSTITDLGLYLLVIFAFDAAKNYLITGLAGVNALSDLLLNISLDAFWNASIFGFTGLFGGLLANNLILALTGFALLSYKPEKVFDRYLQFLVFISSLLFVFSDSMIRSRVLFDLPFPVFCALTVYYIDEEYDKSLKYWIFSYSLLYLVSSLTNLI